MTQVRNKPCAEGMALGENLARFADKSEQRWREELGFVPVRCASCAFKNGTYPNGCLATVADATKCLMEGKPFYCHHRPHPDDPQPLCAGWLLISAEGGQRVECPWPFS